MNEKGSPGGKGATRDRRDQAQHVQSFLLELLKAASTSSGLEEMLATTHRALGKLMDTTNFYVALYDEATEHYSFPFHVDKHETDEQPPRSLPRSLTDYVRRTGQPLFADEKTDELLIREGHVDLVG
ncbi:MAG: hypothetical protein OES47_00295, partial [Acidobacteriota bacterium]|nr:hypothetical protein [Acidobacteriota bacterium]